MTRRPPEDIATYLLSCQKPCCCFSLNMKVVQSVFQPSFSQYTHEEIGLSSSCSDPADFCSAEGQSCDIKTVHSGHPQILSDFPNTAIQGLLWSVCRVMHIELMMVSSCACVTRKAVHCRARLYGGRVHTCRRPTLNHSRSRRLMTSKPSLCTMVEVRYGLCHTQPAKDWLINKSANPDLVACYCYLQQPSHTRIQ